MLREHSCTYSIRVDRFHCIHEWDYMYIVTGLRVEVKKNINKIYKIIHVHVCNEGY